MGGIGQGLLEARGLAIGHGRPLVAGLDFSLRAGEVLCLLGPNGVGKTTLFRTLLGVIPALAGRLSWQGADLAGLTMQARAKALAHVPQSLTTPFAFTALDVVLMGASLGLGPFARPGPAEIRRAEAALERVGAGALADQPVTRLSGGQRQMVLIARALAQEAQLLLMDEPTASLDLANRVLVQKLIRDLAGQGLGILFSCHDPDQAAAISDSALLIGREGVLAAGPVHEVMSAATLSRLYGVAVERLDLPGGGLRFLA